MSEEIRTDAGWNTDEKADRGDIENDSIESPKEDELGEGIEQDVDIMHELAYRPEQMTPVDTSEVYNQLGISPRPVLTGIASLPTNEVFY